MPEQQENLNPYPELNWSLISSVKLDENLVTQKDQIYKKDYLGFLNELQEWLDDVRRIRTLLTNPEEFSIEVNEHEELFLIIWFSFLGLLGIKFNNEIIYLDKYLSWFTSTKLNVDKNTIPRLTKADTRIRYVSHRFEIALRNMNAYLVDPSKRLFREQKKFFDSGSVFLGVLTQGFIFFNTIALRILTEISEDGSISSEELVNKIRRQFGFITIGVDEINSTNAVVSDNVSEQIAHIIEGDSDKEILLVIDEVLDQGGGETFRTIARHLKLRFSDLLMHKLILVVEDDTYLRYNISNTGIHEWLSDDGLLKIQIDL
ncbi:MAG: hypothetical protein ABIM99_03415 [Candidatus Dojkabacteria bacterium]